MKILYGGRARRRWLVSMISAKRAPVRELASTIDVVYLGSDLRSTVNAAGARFLLEHIIPAVEADLPGRIRFHIIGRGNLDLGARAAPPYLHLHGFVDDLDAFLRQIDVSCVPNHLGWGCKLKVVDALARGLPVVGTREAFRGIPSAPGGYFICRTTSDYIAAFRWLLTAANRRKASAIARNAYERWRARGESQLRAILSCNSRCLQ